MDDEAQIQLKIFQNIYNRYIKPRPLREFSAVQMIIYMLIFGCIGFFVWLSLAAAPLVASLEAEQMSLPAGGSIISDSTASSGKAILLSTNGTATGAVNFPSQVNSLTVIARGDQCSGAPLMTIALDGNNSLTGTAVSSTAWSSYTAMPTTSIAPGTHTLTVSFTNAYSKIKGNSGKNSCSRNLYVDITDFYGPSTITPPPAVTISASPSSVIAGQASTLTWNSTNANSCTASGAWSGTEPTSGSISTGALNQTSTYTLTCSGDGGSANASTTITISGFTTSLSPGMTINPPYTWTFNPGVTSVKGYFWADGNLLATAAPDANGTYTFVIQSNTLSSGTHQLGHAWDLADGTHQAPASSYSVNAGSASTGGTIFKTVDYTINSLSQWDWGWQTTDPGGDFAAGPCSDSSHYATRGSMLPIATNFNGYGHAATVKLPTNSCGYPNVAAEGLHKILNEPGIPQTLSGQLRVGQTVYYGYAFYVPSGQSLPTAFWGTDLTQWNYPGFNGAPLGLSLFRSGLTNPAVALIVDSGLYNSSSGSLAYFSGDPQGVAPTNNSSLAPRNMPGPLYAVPSSMFKYDTWFQIIIKVKWTAAATGTTPDTSGLVAAWSRPLNGAWINTVPEIIGFPTLQYDSNGALPTPYGGSYTDKAGAYTTYNDGYNPAWSGPLTLYQGDPLIKGDSFSAVENILNNKGN